jgi:hypothetical protein
MAAGSFGEHQGFWARIRVIGESIAQRSQRGNLGMAADSFGEHQGFLGENQGNRGKHRTEVTEVTEGEFGDGGG